MLPKDARLRQLRESAEQVQHRGKARSEHEEHEQVPRIENAAMPPLPSSASC
jgi:hypothetical protein